MLVSGSCVAKIMDRFRWLPSNISTNYASLLLPFVTSPVSQNSGGISGICFFQVGSNYL